MRFESISVLPQYKFYEQNLLAGTDIHLPVNDPSTPYRYVQILLMTPAKYKFYEHQGTSFHLF